MMIQALDLDPELRIVGNVFVLIGAIAFVAFVIGYAILSNWRNNPWGRAIMRMHGGFALIMVYAAIALFADLPGKMWVRMIAFGIVAALGVQQFIMMIIAQMRTRRENS